MSTQPIPQRGPGAPTTTAPMHSAPSIDRASAHVRRPNTNAVIIDLAGDIDACTVPRVNELLTSRLRASVALVVVDLTDVTFLSTDGLEMLTHADLLARHRGVCLRIHVGESHAVLRALQATGVAATLPLAASTYRFVDVESDAANI